ncbi:LysR substrate-binding domain-containing protein [Acidovorax sp. CCYZU-2555]|uniref:LysR substrate-binding domain-containing protein n=1 Tax=Acidovorax sp. CCYZU-2555 TaxID=2835042 RepID=UPI001BCDE537|nr:LysR substrate-binding domain-containing protein [Acidovorax sp. CCYZU-2555]MBS7780938.1 LysR family transcriptional regulator [Acidovorax sp. CCYZU-2555]
MIAPLSHRAHTPALGALRAFEAAARLGSLSAAAAELHVTKSAISHQLRGLEDALRVPLLLRGASLRRTQLTQEGAKLLLSVQQALALLEATCNDIRGAVETSPAQVLNVSSSQSVATLWLAQSMQRFSQAHPDIALAFHQHSNQKPAWKTQGIDLAILHVRDAGPHFAQEGDIALMEETIVPFCSADHVPRGRENDARFIAESRWIEERHVGSPETGWDLWQARLGLQARGRGATTALSGFATVVAAVQAGAGVGLGRLPFISEDIARGRLVALMPQTCMRGSWRYVARVRPGRAVDAPLAKLIAFMREDALRLTALAGLTARD